MGRRLEGGKKGRGVKVRKGEGLRMGKRGMG
jgi:hypothetical protein